MSTTNILDLNNRIDALEKNSGGGGSTDSAKRSDIASEFSATTAYTAGCFVYYEGKLYQFNADHAAGAWDTTDVVEANVTDQVVSNASAIAGLTASDVAYDNTDSGLTATDVQGAVDEVVTSIAQQDIRDTLNIETGVVVDSAVKNGNMVTITGSSMPISTAGIHRIFSTSILPKTRTIGCIGFASSGDIGNGYIYIDGSGKVDMFYEKATTYGIYFTINYVVR